jgi:hypothetical protein
MLKQNINGLLLFGCTVAILLLSGCKGAAMPKSQAVNAPEKIQSRSSAAAAQSQKIAIGTQQGGARQGVTLGLRNVVSTIAGKVGMADSTDGSDTLAGFDSPKAIATDGVNLYLADSNNHTIRKIDIATGMVTTLAGLAGKKGSHDGKGAVARFNRPFAITTDGGNLYVTDSNNHTIRQLDLDTGMVTTIAGGVGEVGYVDGTGRRARFFIPEGITTDGKYLYVSDTHNHSIRKISLENHAVTTIAGLSGAPGFFDDIGTKARFSSPKGITTDGHYLYVADFGNSQIRKIAIRGGAVTTLSGKVINEENAVEQADAARFNYPSGITTDGRNLYVADTFNRTIRRIAISTGVVTTIAGAEEKEDSVDGAGAEAHFKDPVGITTDGSVLFVTDSTDHIVRKIR